MKLLDLTFGVPPRETRIQAHGQPARAVRTMRTMPWPVPHEPKPYTALIHHLDLWSMSGTYLDFPGHLKETHDGRHASNYPLEKLFRVKTAVIHLNRRSGSGAIPKEELAEACPPMRGAGALIVNALGSRRFDQIAKQSVYLSRESVEWIGGWGIHLFVSDVYESARDPQNVFHRLFSRGISTVCCPVNLARLKTSHALLTVLPLKVPGAMQVPCRILAEWE